MYKKKRKKYYNSLKLKKVTDNKSDKGTNIKKITLVDNEKVISDDKELCKSFSKF